MGLHNILCSMEFSFDLVTELQSITYISQLRSYSYRIYVQIRVLNKVLFDIHSTYVVIHI